MGSIDRVKKAIGNWKHLPAAKQQTAIMQLELDRLYSVKLAEAAYAAGLTAAADNYQNTAYALETASALLRAAAED